MLGLRNYKFPLKLYYFLFLVILNIILRDPDIRSLKFAPFIAGIKEMQNPI